MNEEKRVERFEDLIAWQKARLLTAEIYRVTSQGHFARDFGLAGSNLPCCVCDV